MHIELHVCRFDFGGRGKKEEGGDKTVTLQRRYAWFHLPHCLSVSAQRSLANRLFIQRNHNFKAQCQTKRLSPVGGVGRVSDLGPGYGFFNDILDQLLFNKRLVNIRCRTGITDTFGCLFTHVITP